MGFKVIWTDEAVDDLRQLVAYISKDNPDAAVKLGEKLVQKSMLLVAHPRFGKIFRELGRDNIREMAVPPYRLIYEIDDDGLKIFIRMVHHGARQGPEIK
jgi:addiction module RelE/StbE family toxin